VPDKRNHGLPVGVRRTSSGHIIGHLVSEHPIREAAADKVRARIEVLKAELEAATASLVDLYVSNPTH
jgi:hypothetical protein